MNPLRGGPLDSGAFSDMYPGGSCGAGPAPGGGGAPPGIWPGGVPAKPYGSWAWCQASRRKPNGPLECPDPYSGLAISGTGGARPVAARRGDRLAAWSFGH